MGDPDETVPIADVLTGMTIAPFELDDGDMITEAFVIVMIEHAEQQVPGIGYRSTSGLISDITRIGVLTQVLDRLRDLARDGWKGTD